MSEATPVTELDSARQDQTTQKPPNVEELDLSLTDDEDIAAGSQDTAVKIKLEPGAPVRIKLEPGLSSETSAEVERTKQEKERTKQLQLQLKLAELNNATRLQQQLLSSPQQQQPTPPPQQQPGPSSSRPPLPPRASERAPVPSRPAELPSVVAGGLKRADSFGAFGGADDSDDDDVTATPVLKRSRSQPLAYLESTSTSVADVKRFFSTKGQRRGDDVDVAVMHTFPPAAKSDTFFLCPYTELSTKCYSCGQPCLKKGLLFAALCEYVGKQQPKFLKGGLGVSTFCRPECIQYIPKHGPPNSQEIAGARQRLPKPAQIGATWDRDRIMLSHTLRGQVEEGDLSTEAQLQVQSWIQRGFTFPIALEKAVSQDEAL